VEVISAIPKFLLLVKQENRERYVQSQYGRDGSRQGRNINTHLIHIEMEGEGREKQLKDIQDKAKPYRG
jgi:hypothetical protein